jgi:type III secretion protein V
MSSGVRISNHRYADVALAILLLGIVALMIVPVPTPLLDVLLAANISLAALMLLVAVTIPNGLAFASMPTILLVTTLYRLALNVSSTRLILLQADAGRVIAAFGGFVVRGNYAVGAVVFLILTLIQYIVVARGAERVAEVGARFALDAMPGKQLAIDSDLRSGAVSAEAARELRRTLERESQFYGAMDGAMKFVKGDAIAGIAITAINIVAGVGIGVGMRKLGVVHSLQLYGLLTVGDGLVCQIPSLLISTAAGLVVTRVASAQQGDSLAGDVGRQLFGEPHVLALAAGFLLLLALVPGLPALPFGFCALVLGAASYGLRRVRAEARAPQLTDAELTSGGEGPLRLVLGTELARTLGDGAALEHAIRELRERVFDELGLRFGALRVRSSNELAVNGYALELHEAPLPGAPATTSGAPVQAAASIADALGVQVRRHAAELFGLEQTQRWLDELERSAPALVRALVPKPIALPLLCQVLRRLLAEGVSIRPRERILEALAASSSDHAEPGALTERVRVQLRRQITHAAARDGVLALHALDPLIEDALRDAVAAGAGTLALPPDQARDIVAAVRALPVHTAPRSTVLISQPDVRRHLRALLEAELPDVQVLSYPELAPDVQVEQLQRVRLG